MIFQPNLRGRKMAIFQSHPTGSLRHWQGTYNKNKIILNEEDKSFDG